MATKGNEARGGKVIELNNEKFVVFKKKDGKPGIVAYMQDFCTGIDCPPVQGDECPYGYSEYCNNGEVCCRWEPE